MNTAKKVVALLLCLQLTSIQTVFAQVGTQTQTITQQQIAKEISSSEKYRGIGLVAVAGWATAACALTIMIKSGIKRAQRTHKEQLDIILKDLMVNADKKTLTPYKISEVRRLMEESASNLATIEDKGYFYKHYQTLPVPDEELREFWEKSYTKNGGKIPASFNEYRKVVSDFQLEFNKSLYASSTKKSKAIASLFMDINEKFYTFQSLEGSASQESSALLSSIDKDVKKLNAIAAKEGPEVQKAVGVFTSQLNKEIELKNFHNALAEIEVQAQKAYAGRSAQYSDDIVKLTAGINKNFRNLVSAGSDAEKNKISAIIERDAHALAEIAVKSEAKGIREAAQNFLTRISKEVKGKGGLIGVGAVLVAGTALLFLSGDATIGIVSNNRLLVQRELAFSFQNTPDMFLVSVVNAKEKYGIDAVSSVIYENQAKYYPLFAAQMDVMRTPEGRECLKLLVQGQYASAQQNKATLLAELKK